MSLEKKLRNALALAIFVLVLAGIAAILYLTDTLLDVWQRLDQAPALLRYFYWGSLFLALLLVALGLWRLLRPDRKPAVASGPLTATTLNERLAGAENLGIDVSDARRELEKLALGKSAGTLSVALVGNISTGKSSLIAALVPQAEPLTDVRGGSTRRITRYRWQAQSGDVLEIVDLPGLNEADGRLDRTTLDEALRSHIVLFVCEGDLGRDEFSSLRQLLALEKPLLVAINKKDRYSAAELNQIRDRLDQRFNDLSREPVPVVAISSGGVESVVRAGHDGQRSEEIRKRPPDVDELTAGIERLIDGSSEAIEQLRDRSVFFLVASRLEKARAAHLDAMTRDIVQKYTRRAIVGSLAAISPGTDILIQGYLGTAMVRELCQAYEIRAKQLDIDRFLSLSQTYIGRTLPLLLAVAGNGLKAFPGVGTVAGGLVHAVAYGMIFDALGNSLRQTLSARGDLLPGMAAAQFGESLGENLESRSSSLAKLAVDAARSGLDRDDTARPG